MSGAGPLAPPAMLGVLGGGQLGRYFVIAARKMGYRVTVLDPDADSPAGSLADRHLAAAYDDAGALDELARTCAAATTEFENVPAQSLERLAQSIRVAPSPACVRTAQDRILEKRFFEAQGVPVGPWRAIESEADLAAAKEFPGILKRARFGYDGKGQTRVADAAKARAAWQTKERAPCVLEALLPLDTEVSVVLARSAAGEVRAFPVVENRHRNGTLDVSLAPARVAPALAEEAVKSASAIAQALDYVGVLAVEFFVSGGKLYANEMAPRPHNSGHYTIDACAADQFEQQVRALAGLPLAAPRLLSPACMVNLMGELWAKGEPDWLAVLGTAHTSLHLYGKRAARAGRKMGHFTVLDAERDAALAQALRLRKRLGIPDA